MIYQELTLAPHLSVEENILLGIEPRRLGWIRSRERRALAAKALAELHHEGIPLDGPVNRRTIAEQQIVEIARALAADPTIMLLDEPFAGIDPISIADIRELVRELKQRDIGVLITDHNVRETLDIVDRACIIYDGQVLFQGTPEALVADSEVRRLYLGESFAL